MKESDSVKILLHFALKISRNAESLNKLLKFGLNDECN
jgi:hypothetical protein